jgi:hypothetical protein
VLVGSLVEELRDKCPSAFAGVAYAADGALEVFSTGDAELDAIVSRFAARASDIHPRVLAGRSNSLQDLEAVRDAIFQRMQAPEPHVRVLELGVDVRANCVRVGIAPFTPEAAANFEREFGTGKTCVVKGGYYQPV